MYPIDILEELDSNYRELWEKLNNLYVKHHEDEKDMMISRFKLIMKNMETLNHDIEALLADFDRTQFNLTEEEKQRVEDDEIRDRAIDRIKPLMLLSLMYESGWFDSPEVETPPVLVQLDHLKSHHRSSC